LGIRYHSDPYFLDVNSNPSYQNVTATFIDNYSQVCIDFAKTNAGRIKLATRFGGMDVYLMSAKDIPEVVKYVVIWFSYILLRTIDISSVGIDIGLS
jgi:hypothetical protein